MICWPSKYPITCITRQHWMKSSKQTAWRPVLSNLRSRSRYTWGASSTFGGRFETLQPPVQEEAGILFAPEDWGCSQRWWEPAATRTGLLSLTCPWNQNFFLLVFLWCVPSLYKIRNVVHTCQKPWNSFASRPHIARELQTLCSKSHRTCLCQTDLEAVVVLITLKQCLSKSYLSCCRWWPCWTRCRCHWPKPSATRQEWLSQICSCQLYTHEFVFSNVKLVLSGISHLSK